MNRESIQSGFTSLTIARISNDLQNQANFILTNSQIMIDIWNDVIRILEYYHKGDLSRELIFDGLPLDEVKEIVPQLLTANITGSSRISKIAGLVGNSTYMESNGPDSVTVKGSPGKAGAG